MTKREYISNKHSRRHSHLSYSHSRPISISLSNLVPIPMRIPREGWESRISHSHAHLYLGSILFLIFINDLPDSIQYSNILLYADDAKIFKRINCMLDCVLFQRDLDSMAI